MAGHSHWSKIKRAKGATDAKRGKLWSKVAKKIMIAGKNGGDPRDNLALRYTIDEAKGVNMPKLTGEGVWTRATPWACVTLVTGQDDASKGGISSRKVVGARSLK